MLHTNLNTLHAHQGTCVEVCDEGCEVLRGAEGGKLPPTNALLLLLPISVFGSTKATRVCLVPAGCMPCLCLTLYATPLSLVLCLLFLPFSLIPSVRLHLHSTQI